MITLKVFTFVCLDIWYFLTAHISVWCISPTLENAFSFITPSLSSKTVTFSLSFFGFLHMAFIWTIKNHQPRPQSPKQQTWKCFRLCFRGFENQLYKFYLLNINQSLSLEYQSSLAESRLSGSCPVKAAPQALSALSRTCQLGLGTWLHILYLSSSNATALQRLQILRQVHKIETTKIVNCHCNWGTRKHVFFCVKIISFKLYINISTGVHFLHVSHMVFYCSPPKYLSFPY